MRKVAFLFLSIAVLSACNNTTNQAEVKTENQEETVSVDYQYYGDTITAENPISTDALLAEMKKNDTVMAKVEGTINSSCTVKGCWMKMDMGNGQEMHVTFKDYGFFVPKNLDGETAIMEGYAITDTIGVDHLRHLAHDAGKFEEEIAAINEPEVTVSFEATGVIIKPKS